MRCRPAPTAPPGRFSRALAAARAALAALALTLWAGTAAAQMFSVAPTNLDFGNVAVGTDSQLAVTVTNTSGVPQTLSTMAVGGIASSIWQIRNNCLGRTLSPGETCQVSYEFRPTALGPQTATSAIRLHDGVNHTITVTGTGVPAFSVAPTSLDFGNVAVGTDSQLAVTVTNTSGVPQTLSTIALGGIASSIWQIRNNCLGRTLSPGETCQVSYEFRPTTLGPQTATSAIRLHDGVNHTITVTGIGMAPLAPGAPTITSAVPGPGQAVLTLVASNDLGAPLQTGYTATCTPQGGGAAQSASGPGPVLTVTGLAPGVAHDCTASATNGLLSGPPSTTAVVVPLALPPVPTLGEWALLLLGAMAGALGVRRLRGSLPRKVQ